MQTVIDRLTSNKKVTAKWTLKSHKYILILNGGSFGSDTNASESSVFIDTAGGETTIIPTPVKKGYIFDGWYVSPNFNGQKTSSFINEYNIYYAKWTEIKYAITFSLGNITGSTPYFKYKSLSFTFNNLPLTLGLPVADGYNFNGWHTDSVAEGTENIVSEISPENVSSLFSDSNEATLYAGWKQNTITVTEEMYCQNETQTGYNLQETFYVTDQYIGDIFRKTVKSYEGFTETEKSVADTQKTIINGLVVKRYFNRNVYNVILQCSNDFGAHNGLEHFVYNDTLVELPSVKANGRYHFVSWVDVNGNQTQWIPAHTSSDVTYYACFTQDAPAFGEDYTVSPAKDSFTISGNSPYLKLSDNNNFAYDSSDESYKYVYQKSAVYPSNVTTTKVVYIYFDNIGQSNTQNGYVMRSDNTKIEVKMTVDKPTVSTTTSTSVQMNTANKTISPAANASPMELVNGNTCLDFTSAVTDTSGNTTYNIRFKETFCTLPSDITSVVIGTGTEQSAPESFTVIPIDYTGVGYVSINSSHLSNANGHSNILQYKDGESNGWTNVSSTGNLAVHDKKVYFRYGPTSTYLASPSIEIDVGVQEYTVHFDLNPSNMFVKNTLKDNTESFENITVLATEPQLSLNDTYLENVRSLKRFGYRIDFPRETQFWHSGTALADDSMSQLNDSTNFNEANIITGDMTLYAGWIRNASKGFTYTDTISIGTAGKTGTNDFSIIKEFELKSKKSKDFYFGQNCDINVVNSFKPSSSDDVVIDNVGFLKYLDENTGLYPSDLSRVLYSSDNKTWNIVSVSVNNATTSIALSGTTTPSVIDHETFDYKFKSLFDMKEDTSLSDMSVAITIDPDNLDNNVICILSKVYANGYTKYRFYKESESYVIDFYGDVNVYQGSDALSDISSDSSIILPAKNNDNKPITVNFHATLSHCAKMNESISIEKAVYTKDDYYNVVSDNSVSSGEGWTVKRA